MNNIAKEKILEKKAAVGGFFLLIIVLLGISIYVAGYRFTDNFTLGKKGRVSLTLPLSGTAIFVDESEKILTTKDNETVTLSFSPKTHSVIVARDGYFPWKKDFQVESDKTIILSPLIVSQNASGMIITTNDPQYTSIKNSVLKVTPPTKEKTVLSYKKDATLWLEDNAVFVRHTGNTEEVAHMVIQPDTVIKNVEFYKNGSDVVVFSTGNAVYAIETSSLGGQNFLPIYKGQNPNFTKASDNSLYVLDGENLMEVVI